MKLALQLTTAGLTAMFLASCSTTGSSSSGGNSVGIGPFDSAGRYREEWADDPSKWRKGGGSNAVASNDEVPADSIPLPSPSNTREPGIVAPAPTPIVRTTKPSPDRPAVTKRPPVRNPDESTASRGTKPKPKSVAVKVKPKPKTARYTIKKGDTLSAIASRNGTSVAALQRANGIKGSLIQPGKSLVIPK